MFFFSYKTEIRNDIYELIVIYKIKVLIIQNKNFKNIVYVFSCFRHQILSWSLIRLE